LETSLDSVIVPEVVSKVADTTTALCPDFTVTKSMGAAAENEIVVPRSPSTLGLATGEAHDTLGLSTVRTLSRSPWLASASPEALSPVSTTTATTSRRARFRLPRRTCLAIDPYLLLRAATGILARKSASAILGVTAHRCRLAVSRQDCSGTPVQVMKPSTSTDSWRGDP
jgi:hypothetical protein